VFFVLFVAKLTRTDQSRFTKQLLKTDPRRKYFRKMQKKLLKLVILSVITALISCAHQISPSGGPDDKISPTITSSFPKAESVNVPIKSHVILNFSEWISKKSDRGVSIYPPLKVKIVVDGNRLEIIPVTAFADSTTYHISINTLLLDLHNNPILSPISLTFSTGNTLDSGILSGCIIDPSKKVLQPKVALFRKEHIKADSGFTIIPDYLLQTDSTGNFEFLHVKKSNYYTVGYFDLNSDNLIQPGTEQVYIPTDSLIIISAATKPIILFPAIYDTIRPALLSAKAISSTILSGQWVTALDLKNGFTYPQCSVERIDSVSTPIQGNYIPLPNEKIFTLRLKSPLQSAPYRLIYTLKTHNNIKFSDTITFNGVITSDTVKPVLQSWIPNSGTTDLDPVIKLIWSKPVTINAPLQMIDSTGDTVVIKATSGYSDTSILSLQRHFHPDSKYRLVLLNNIGNDLAGNSIKVRDSTDTVNVIKLQTISGDSLAISMQGGATCLDKSNHRKWLFKLFSRNTTYLTQDKSGQFKFDSIPSGKGQLYYFEDLNENNKPDQGRLSPWTAPEPYFSSPDTVEARARWEVEGIDVRVCEPCRKKLQDTVKIEK
jgi:hypothetical protein